MATDKTDTETVIRSTIGEFCVRANTFRSELARRLGVKKQQISNWQLSDCLVEHNTETGEVKIIRAEKVLSKCKY